MSFKMLYCTEWNNYVIMGVNYDYEYKSLCFTVYEGTLDSDTCALY